MNILIIYSSAFGTTQKTAEKIGNVLKAAQFSVTVLSIDQTHSLDGYDTVIMGSSIRASRILANVRDFIGRFKNDLASKNLFFFVVCLTAKCEKGRKTAIEDYINPVFEKYPELVPVDTQAFGGKIEADKFNPVMKRMMRRVVNQAGLPDKNNIDVTNTSNIEDWANKLVKILKTKIKES